MCGCAILDFAFVSGILRDMELRVKSGESLPEALKAARGNAKMSQEKLAARLGVATRTLQNWEAGKITPQPKHRRALAEFLEEAA